MQLQELLGRLSRSLSLREIDEKWSSQPDEWTKPEDKFGWLQDVIAQEDETVKFGYIDTSNKKNNLLL